MPLQNKEDTTLKLRILIPAWLKRLREVDVLWTTSREPESLGGQVGVKHPAFKAPVFERTLAQYFLTILLPGRLWMPIQKPIYL